MSAARHFHALLLLCPLALCAEELKCSHKGLDEYWINKITIDTETKKVLLDVGPYRAPVSVIEGELIYADDSKINGYPAYAFNAPAGSKPNQINAFKLFHVFNSWRLIDAGILFMDGRPTLVALGSTTEFNCHVR